MTYIEPDSPAGQPDITPPDTPGPDIDPGSTPEEAPGREPGILPADLPGPDIDPSGAPEEAPQQDPGGGEPGDSRPYG